MVQIMEIKVLGAGCAKCKATYELLRSIVEKNGVAATVVKVEDVMELLSHNVLSTPAIVIDGVVRFKGRVPTESEARKLVGLES